jgi:uncharacterized protein
VRIQLGEQLAAAVRAGQLTATAARLAAGTRVLVTCGTADTNVPCGTLPPLLAGLRHARTAGPGRVTLFGVDHPLHPAGTATNDQILAPSAVSALRAFLGPYAPAGS